ncbi:hypothetical protein [Lachnoclostridium sp. An169]|uniref:hypothetical protein n=1 Tax=Lachnoclostridium sp. An169 TaxID=1965569 RepID=UPI0013A60BF0|nr:hypothetical protein [Lachnoclostridium sp. An169]
MKTTVIYILLAIAAILGFILPMPFKLVTMFIIIPVIIYLVIDIFISVKKRQHEEEQKK